MSDPSGTHAPLTMPPASAEESPPKTEAAPTVSFAVAESLASEATAPHARQDAVHIAGFEVLVELGRGGMGVVYQARQTRLKRLVALKMIRTGAYADDGERARFRSEAEAIARLQHPNIVQIHEVGEHDGQPFFALEYCAAGSLAGKLRENPLTAKEAAKLVETLAGAMQSAHVKGIIHRDLKPANVLLLEDGTPKITDFGLARQLDEAGQTQSGAIMGTPSYMPPEQAAGKGKEIGPAADIYALGAILYECLTGRPPFRAPTVMDTVLQVLHDEPVPPSQLQSQTPKDLETICLKCLRKEPQQRYPDAQALADDLRRFQNGEPIVARSVRRTERLSKWVRRNPALATAVTIAVLALVTGTLVSTCLAFLADHRATTADQNAADARRAENDAQQSERNAKDSAARALKSEKHAQVSLEEAEITLAESLLRPIGYDNGPPGGLELAALQELADLSNENVRTRFLRSGLASHDTARRLGLRSDAVVRALVGLDPQRSKVMEKILLERLQQPGQSLDTMLACLALASALRCEDEQLADLGSRLLLDLANRPDYVLREGVVQSNMTNVNDADLLRVLGASAGLTRGISPARADAHIEAILAAIAKKSDQKTTGPTRPNLAIIHKLAALLPAMLGRLSKEKAPKRANEAVSVILAATRRGYVFSQTMSKDGRLAVNTSHYLRMEIVQGCIPWLNPEQAASQAQMLVAEMRDVITDPGKGPRLQNKPGIVRELAMGLRSLLERMPPEQAGPCAAQAVEFLVAATREEGPKARPLSLATGAQELAPYLSADAAVPLADVLAERLGKTTDCEQLVPLASALSTVLTRLPADQAAVHADKAAEHLVTTLLENIKEAKEVVPKGLARPFFRSTGDPTVEMKPVAQLAKHLQPLLQFLAAEPARAHAFRAAKELVPAVLDVDDEADRAAYLLALKRVADHLSAKEAHQFVAPWLLQVQKMAKKKGIFFMNKPPTPAKELRPKEGKDPELKPPIEIKQAMSKDKEDRYKKYGPKLVRVLAERLPVDVLLAAVAAAPSIAAAPPGMNDPFTLVLKRRAETMSAEEADKHFGLLLAALMGYGAQNNGLRLPTTFPPKAVGAFKALCSRLSDEQAPLCAAVLVERLANTAQANVMHPLTEALEMLLSRMPEEQAAPLAAKAVQAMVDKASKVARDPTAATESARALRVLAHRVPADKAAGHIEALLKSISEASTPRELCDAAWHVRALTDRLPPADAEKALTRAAQRLAAELSKAESVSAYVEIAGTLGHVADRVPIRLGEEHVIKVLPWAEKMTRGLELPPLAKAAHEVLARLPAERAAHHAEALARHIVKEADKTKSPLDLLSLAQSLQAIGGHVSSEVTGKHAERLVDVLFKVWDEVPEAVLTEQMADAIQAVAAVLPAAPARRSADRILTVMSKAKAPAAVGHLVQVHTALSKRLPDEQASRQRVAAVLACVTLEVSAKSAERTSRPSRTPPSLLPPQLTPLVAACTTNDLVDVLRSPTCTGEVQTWFLTELSRRCRHEFRSVWDVMEWCERNRIPLETRKPLPLIGG